MSSAVFRRYLTNIAANTPRQRDFIDLCIVGAGPAGLSAAIRFKQLDKENKYRVVVLEKGSELGSHILSGMVLDPRGIKELFPNFEEECLGDKKSGVLLEPVTADQFKFLTSWGQFPLPITQGLINKNKNYVGSLGTLVRWLGRKAESLGVEIYTGIGVSDLLYNKDSDRVLGVLTRDHGLDRDGKPKSTFERGMEFRSRQVLLAEGCHGSLTKQIINKYGLRDGRGHQSYGLGLKEIWKVKSEHFQKGLVAHTMGYPLSKNVYGGGFQYHFGDNLVAVGLVVGLDYANPYVSPYQEFQKLKHHRFYSKVLDGGECIAYGARALNEGGYQAIPKLTFPGGMLVGASAGFMNVPRIKGSHTAMKSGLLAAESCYKEISKMASYEELLDEDGNPKAGTASELEKTLSNTKETYDDEVHRSWIRDELYEVRNIRPSFNTPLGVYGGMSYSGLDSLFLKGRVPWTFSFGESDPNKTKEAKYFKPINYPKPDGKLTFDIMTSVSRTGTHHDENEPCHLRIGSDQDLVKHTLESYPKYKGIENRFCPAGVYEYVPDKSAETGVRFQINSTNCIHCKTCDIKAPTKDINWVVPEGGDGPEYTIM